MKKVPTAPGPTRRSTTRRVGPVAAGGAAAAEAKSGCHHPTSRRRLRFQAERRAAAPVVATVARGTTAAAASIRPAAQEAAVAEATLGCSAPHMCRRGRSRSSDRPMWSQRYSPAAVMGTGRSGRRTPPERNRRICEGHTRQHVLDVGRLGIRVKVNGADVPDRDRGVAAVGLHAKKKDDAAPVAIRRRGEAALRRLGDGHL